MSMTPEEFERRLLTAPKALRGLVRKTLRAAALTAEGKAKQRVTGGNPLHTRSGRLRASIRSGLRKDGGTMEAFVAAGGQHGSGRVAYARIHELGGIIRPKAGKYLAIPLDPAKTPAGVAKGPPRAFVDLVFAQTRGGQPLLVHKETGAAWFLLRRQVKIPRRPFLGPSVREATDQLPSALSRLLERALVAEA